MSRLKVIDKQVTVANASQLHSEITRLQDVIFADETEHNWEKMDAALARFTLALRGGACDFEDDFISAFRDKDMIRCFSRCLLTERTRLSASALDLLAASTKLGSAFRPLVPIYVPVLVQLLQRPNKIYVLRTQTCLTALIHNTKLPTILPFLVEGLAERSPIVRQGCMTAIHEALAGGPNQSMILDKDSLNDRLLTSIEETIRKAATDKDPKIRETARSVYMIYVREWPTREESFSAPLTPIVRRYLNLAPQPANALRTSQNRAQSPTRQPLKPNMTRPASPDKKRPLSPEKLSSARDKGYSRPASPSKLPILSPHKSSKRAADIPNLAAPVSRSDKLTIFQAAASIESSTSSNLLLVDMQPIVLPPTSKPSRVLVAQSEDLPLVQQQPLDPAVRRAARMAAVRQASSHTVGARRAPGRAVIFTDAPVVPAFPAMLPKSASSESLQSQVPSPPTEVDILAVAEMPIPLIEIQDATRCSEAYRDLDLMSFDRSSTSIVEMDEVWEPNPIAKLPLPVLPTSGTDHRCSGSTADLNEDWELAVDEEISAVALIDSDRQLDIQESTGSTTETLPGEVEDAQTSVADLYSPNAAPTTGLDESIPLDSLKLPTDMVAIDRASHKIQHQALEAEVDIQAEVDTNLDFVQRSATEVIEMVSVEPNLDIDVLEGAVADASEGNVHAAASDAPLQIPPPSEAAEPEANVEPVAVQKVATPQAIVIDLPVLARKQPFVPSYAKSTKATRAASHHYVPFKPKRPDLPVARSLSVGNPTKQKDAASHLPAVLFPTSSTAASAKLDLPQAKKLTASPVKKAVAKSLQASEGPGRKLLSSFSKQAIGGPRSKTISSMPERSKMVPKSTRVPVKSKPLTAAAAKQSGPFKGAFSTAEQPKPRDADDKSTVIDTIALDCPTQDPLTSPVRPTVASTPLRSATPVPTEACLLMSTSRTSSPDLAFTPLKPDQQSHSVSSESPLKSVAADVKEPTESNIDLPPPGPRLSAAFKALPPSPLDLYRYGTMNALANLIRSPSSGPDTISPRTRCVSMPANTSSLAMKTFHRATSDDGSTNKAFEVTADISRTDVNDADVAFEQSTEASWSKRFNSHKSTQSGTRSPLSAKKVNQKSSILRESLLALKSRSLRLHSPVKTSTLVSALPWPVSKPAGSPDELDLGGQMLSRDCDQPASDFELVEVPPATAGPRVMRI